MTAPPDTPAVSTHRRFLKVIACEIALREICHAVAQSPSLVDLEFLPQGLHDTPTRGRDEIQRRLDAVPAGKYDAVLIGYGLCSSILKDLCARDTRLVIPRAHDCITFFLGSKERYQQCFTERPGTYYFTAGWLEVRQRRDGEGTAGHGGFMPANSAAALQLDYQHWVAKYGEDQARYLMEVMAGWSTRYTHGTLIDFDFTRPLRCREEVERVCQEKGWQFEALEGDLSLLRRWLNGDWTENDFLVVPPGRSVVPSFDEGVIACSRMSPADGHQDRASTA